MQSAPTTPLARRVQRAAVRPPARRWLPLGAVVGPALFTATWFALGFVSRGYTMWDVRVDNYSAISQPLSGLGLGDTAPVMNSAFVVTGVLTIAGAVGIFRSIPELSWRNRRLLTGLLSLHGLGAIVSGMFTLESILPHFGGFALALTPIVTFPAIGRSLAKIPRWQRVARWLKVAGAATLMLAVLHFATFNPEAAGSGAGIAGLTQRILILHIQAWIVAMAWKAHRESYPAAVVAS